MRKVPDILIAAGERLSTDGTAATGEEARSRRRERRIALNFSASLAARLVTVVTGFLAVPLMVHHLGAERYGVWLTLNSFLAFLAFADLGIGNGLVNAVSQAYGKDDEPTARCYISAAFFILLGLVVVMGLISLIVFPLVPWPAVFATKTESAGMEAAPAVLVLIVLFVIQMPLTIVERVNLGYQKGYVNGMFQALGSVLGLGALYVVVILGLSLPWIVLAFMGAPILAVVANWWTIFTGSRRDVSPVMREVRADITKRLVRLGGLFFTLQVAVAVAFASDSIVAAQVLGPEAVTRLGIPSRLFNLVLSVISMACMPLWPAYSEAIASGDIGWVKRTLRKSLGLILFVTLPAMVLLVGLGNEILQLWVGEDARVSWVLLFGLATWTVLAAVGNAISVLLNAANVLRFQVAVASGMALIAICLKILLAYRFGIEGIVWGMVIAYGAGTLLPCLLYLKWVLPRRWPVQIPPSVLDGAA